MKKLILAGIAVLVLLTIVLAFVHLTGQTPENAGEITVNGIKTSLAELKLKPVSGTIVNGKGEKKQIEANGISLAELIKGDYSVITVEASDEYHAVIGKDEAGNAYLIVDESNSARLVVFGDRDSKRDVKNVVRLNTE